MGRGGHLVLAPARKYYCIKEARAVPPRLRVPMAPPHLAPAPMPRQPHMSDSDFSMNCLTCITLGWSWSSDFDKISYASLPQRGSKPDRGRGPDAVRRQRACGDWTHFESRRRSQLAPARARRLLHERQSSPRHAHEGWSRGEVQAART